LATNLLFPVKLPVLSSVIIEMTINKMALLTKAQEKISSAYDFLHPTEFSVMP